MTNPKREHTYLMLDSDTKSGLKKLAAYRHTTLANLIEEGARMVIHRESARIREDIADLHNVSRMVRN